LGSVAAYDATVDDSEAGYVDDSGASEAESNVRRKPFVDDDYKLVRQPVVIDVGKA
jgi:hypothetical protein